MSPLVSSSLLPSLRGGGGGGGNQNLFSQMGCRICQSHCHSFGIPNSLPFFCSPFSLLIFFKTILNFVIHFHSLQRWQHICSGVVPILFSFPSGTESVCANASWGFGCGFVLWWWGGASCVFLLGWCWNLILFIYLCFGISLVSRGEGHTWLFKMKGFL